MEIVRLGFIYKTLYNVLHLTSKCINESIVQYHGESKEKGGVAEITCLAFLKYVVNKEASVIY